MMPELNRIYQGDCLDIMRGWPDGFADLVLTDPPYGINITRKSNNFGTSTHTSRKATGQSWDDIIPDAKTISEMLRVSKNQIVFGANYFWECFRSSPCYVIWDKRGNLPKVPFCDTEFAWSSFNKMSKKYTVINHGFITDVEEPKEHPTQKPEKLFTMILQDFAKEGEIILDPFCGSGTTCIAAERLGMRWIGIEREQQYVAIAQARIDAERRQGKLF